MTSFKHKALSVFFVCVSQRNVITCIVQEKRLICCQQRKGSNIEGIRRSQIDDSCTEADRNLIHLGVQATIRRKITDNIIDVILRSTIDQLFSVKHILRCGWECDIDVYQIFVDFRQTYDSINSCLLYTSRCV